jgi:hypothetical protein
MFALACLYLMRIFRQPLFFGLQIIQSCWRIDPAQRPSFQDLYAILDDLQVL